MNIKKDKKTCYTIGLQVPGLHNKYFFPILKSVFDAIKSTGHNLIIFPGQFPNAPYNHEYQWNVIYNLINNKTGPGAALTYLIEERHYKKIAFIKDALNNVEAEERLDKNFIQFNDQSPKPYNISASMGGNDLCR